MRRKYHLNSPLWPKFAINGDNVDGNELPLGENQTMSMSASKILFSTDEQAYREVLLQYLSAEEEDQVEEKIDE